MGWLRLAGGIAKLFNGLLEWMNFRRIKKVGKQEAELEGLREGVKRRKTRDEIARDMAALDRASIIKRMRKRRGK